MNLLISRGEKIINLVFQIFLSFAALLVIYMIAALLDNDDFDFIAMAGFLTFQPLFAVILSTITISIVFVAGLPIRLHRTINQWWKNHPFLPIIGGCIALVLIVLAYNVNLRESTEVTIDQQLVQKQIPNKAVIVSGWFLLAFSAMHFYPLALLRKIKDYFTSRSK